MRSKQLLTALCALGILGSGACFLPPPRDIEPPPPPLHVDLRGSRKIRVEVTNSSPSQHIDARDLAWAVTTMLNQKANESGITAYEDGQSKSGDAVLRISILRESAIGRQAGAGPVLINWQITIVLDATLTASDGAILWQKTNTECELDYADSHPDADAPWDEPWFRKSAYFIMFKPLVTQVWHGN